MIPLLLKPKLLSLRNRWIRNFGSKTQLVRDIVLAFFSFGIMYAIYDGGVRSLDKLHGQVHFVYLHPSLPIGLILIMLLMMLVFSNSVAALGTLFIAHDLDLVLASPLSTFKFFWGKFIEVFMSSSWMAAVFVLPALLAFGTHYNASIEYYLIGAIALLPYFAIPSAISMVLVTLAARVFPATRARALFICIVALLVLALYFFAETLAPEGTSFQDIHHILRMIALLSLPNTSWVPSYWTATSLGELLVPTGKTIFPYLLILYSVAAVLISLAFITLRLLHFEAYSKAKSNTYGIRLQSKSAQERLVMITPYLAQPYRAIIGKELKSFARDMTQAVQLILLLGLCMIYLYNFRILRAVSGLPEATQLWWEGFLVMANVAMGAFVITAVGTRFVFPSISLEGQSFWILQTAPISVKDLLKAKFWCWLIPVASISSVILASGALAIHAKPQIVIINALSSWIISYGIVGLGVGLGAFFANFTWEHSSQLAASFGSLIYMLFCTLLIAINMLPTSVLIFLRTLRLFGYTFSAFEWYVSVACVTFLLIYINYSATRWALKIGENALLERMKQ